MRSEIIERAIKECLNEMYQKSQPSITWDEIVEKYESGEYDENTKVYEKHYLPSEECKEIEEKYIQAYRIHNEWDEDADLMIDYLQKGGIKDKYISSYTDENGNYHPGYRSYENTPKLEDALKDIINNSETEKRVLDKVFELMRNCQEFYCPNREENRFRFSISSYSPSCNKEAVQKNYSDITIHEREYDPINEMWINVDDKQLEEWEEQIELYKSFNDEWFVNELTNLINKYK